MNALVLLGAFFAGGVFGSVTMALFVALGQANKARRELDEHLVGIGSGTATAPRRLRPVPPLPMTPEDLKKREDVDEALRVAKGDFPLGM